MKINDEWSIEAGQDQFILVHHKPGKNPKTGEPTVSESRTYHPNLQQVANKITRTSTLSALSKGNLEDFMLAVSQAASEISDAVQELKR